MKNITTTLYSYDELSEDAKDKAIEEMYDINVNHDWWEFTYDDAETIGLKITGFDIDRGSYCSGDFINSAYSVAKSIIKNTVKHAKHTRQHKTI